MIDGAADVEARIDRRRLLGLTTAAGLTLAASRVQAAGPTVRTFAYGPDPAHRLDVYPDPRLRGAPVLLYVHGGGWRAGSRRRGAPLAGYARAHRSLLISIDYRLVPLARDAGDCAEDVAAAVGWAFANAAAWGGAPRRIFLVGHSAGAHLAALVATDPAYLAAGGLRPEQLAGLVLLDGMPYDAAPLVRIGRRWPDAVPDWLMPGVARRPAELSPTRRIVDGRRYPPMLVVHAGHSTNLGHDAARFVRRLRRAGGTATLMQADGDGHRGVNAEFGLAGDREGERAARFIASGRL